MGHIARAYTPMGPIRALFDFLEAAHINKGTPGVREIAQRTGLAVGTVHNALKGPVVPKLDKVDVLAIYFNADRDHAKALQIAATVEVRLRGLPPGAYLINDLRHEAEVLYNEITSRAYQLAPNGANMKILRSDAQLRRQAFQLANLIGKPPGQLHEQILARFAEGTLQERQVTHQALQRDIRHTLSFPAAPRACDYAEQLRLHPR